MIYRGFNITRNENGTYGIHSQGGYAPITEEFPTEEAAMNFIDALKRKLRFT